MVGLALLSLLVLVLFPLSLLLLLSILVRPRPVKVPIKGRHVFITGGSSGIGLALAHRAASEGARVSILARSFGKLEEARNSIRLSTGVDVSIYSADVRDFEALSRVIDEADPIDVLICNQGVYAAQELDSQEMKEVSFIIDVNLVGTFHLIKAALPKMKSRTDRRPASIALMSSQAGQVGIYGYTAYSASKFGLRGLGEALQQELISDDIRVSLIFPPDTETPGLVEDISIFLEPDLDIQCLYCLVDPQYSLAENKSRPELTKLIASSCGALKAEEVAERTLNGIKSGAFTVTCNFDGIMLALATAGLSPQSFYLVAFCEVLLAGFMRLVGLFFQWTWYGTIERWHAQKNRS